MTGVEKRTPRQLKSQQANEAASIFQPAALLSCEPHATGPWPRVKAEKAAELRAETNRGRRAPEVGCSERQVGYLIDLLERNRPALNWDEELGLQSGTGGTLPQRLIPLKDQGERARSAAFPRRRDGARSAAPARTRRRPRS